MSTPYQWYDSVIWREESNHHLMLSQEDRPRQGDSATSDKPNVEPSTPSAEALPKTLSELRLSKSPLSEQVAETIERAMSPMDTTEASETAISQPLPEEEVELDSNAVQAQCPVDPTVRGPYPTVAKAKQKDPAAVQPQYRAGEYVPPAEKQDNVNFVSRSMQLNNEFTAATVAEALTKIRERQEFIAKDYYEHHYQAAQPQHDSPPVPDEKLQQ